MRSKFLKLILGIESVVRDDERVVTVGMEKDVVVKILILQQDENRKKRKSFLKMRHQLNVKRERNSVLG